MLGLLGAYLTFKDPEKFWILTVLLPTLSLLFAWHFFGTRAVLQNNRFLALHRDEAKPRPRLYIALSFAFSLLATGLVAVWAEPMWRTQTQTVVYGGVRIAFLKDVSPSMKWAHDVPPFPDRLTAAKSVLADFATMTERDPELRGAYYRAIIPFAGSSIPYMPFSTSYDEFIDAIDAIDEMTVNDPGTYIFGAFREYEQMVKSHPTPDQSTTDIVILISDGGKEEGNYKDLSSIKALLGRMPNTIVYTVGIGSVAVTVNEHGEETRKSVKVPLVIRDRTGAFVGYALEDPANSKSPRLFSELDERVLMELSGKERYVLYTNKDELLQTLKRAILEHRKVLRTNSVEHRTPISQWLLVLVLLVACVMFGYAERPIFVIRTSLKRFRDFLRRITPPSTPRA